MTLRLPPCKQVIMGTAVLFKSGMVLAALGGGTWPCMSILIRSPCLQLGGLPTRVGAADERLPGPHA